MVSNYAHSKIEITFIRKKIEILRLRSIIRRSLSLKVDMWLSVRELTTADQGKNFKSVNHGYFHQFRNNYQKHSFYNFCAKTTAVPD